MLQFHGDLLLGGARLRELEGQIDESNGDQQVNWSGEFRIAPDQVEMVEIGRPYLLVLNDGRTGRVQITAVTRDREDQSLICFRPVGGHPR